MKRRRNEKNLPLANQLVCTSGFDPEENNELISKITENGGQYCDNLIKGTNYLISSRICTKKSQVFLSPLISYFILASSKSKNYYCN